MAMAEDGFLKLDNQLCFVLYAASRMLTKLYGPFLAKLDMTYPQYLVMLVLWEQDHQTVTAIGKRLYLDTGTLTPLLKRLEAQGRISRNRSADDERKVVVTLTQQGKALKNTARSIPEALFCRSGLTLEEFLSLKTSVSDLLLRMDAEMKTDHACDARLEGSG
ncbi:MarR family winged helix-turn-helix transcriptional regulator [Desulfatitalea alkaliphila]|uniref:MarR family transcriptional regulator n=1 Tax=Desulfatitalea alkaliphila TaxID=2929485 RepID=A0AA41R0Y5_9BACT|nr:MarR family transcriptional regulator [Desulfatitalea alkaliphila]MCJ8500299.1 MarR family transcriptional regulator [Desulfatitalea alkaliphila]